MTELDRPSNYRLAINLITEMRMTPPTLIHLHLPRSAGTTINTIFGQALVGKRHFAYTEPGQGQIFHAMSPAERDRIDFLFGHFPYGLHRFFDRPVNYVSAVREPRRRILSIYRFILMHKTYPLHHLVKSRTDDFSSFLCLAAIDQSVREEIDNLQVRLLAGQMSLIAEYDDGLSLALAHLNAGNFFIAGTDRLEPLLLWFQQAYQVNCGAVPRLNASEEGPSLDEELDRLQPQARRHLEHFTKWDMTLYEIATNRADVNAPATTHLPIVRARASTEAPKPASEAWPIAEEDYVRALYRVLLSREPDPAGLAGHVQMLRDGRPCAEIMRGFLRSREFGEKQAAFKKTYFAQNKSHDLTSRPDQFFVKKDRQASWIPDLAYRCPTDLTVTPLSLRRVMVIGQCLMVAWPNVIEGMMPGCKCDFLLFNRVQQLPAQPPAEPSAYDFQLITVPLREVLPDSGFFRLSYLEPKAYKELFHESCERLRYFLTAAMRWNRELGLLTFVTNFILPQQNPMGRLLPRYDLRNLVYFVERLNQVLADELRGFNNAFLFDYDQIIATFGRKYCQDDVICISNHNGLLSDYDFEFDQGRLEPPVLASSIYEQKVQLAFELGWKELLAMYRAILQLDMVKLLVVDLDDTLWRGVAVERTEHSGETIEGWPLGVAEALGHLKRRGVLLALISKNEEKLVRPIWQRLFEGRLSLDDFVVRKINWRPKIDNFEEILQEVNLLPRSAVYIDDNPVERAAVESAFPGVRTFGPNPLVWRRILLWSAETQVATITNESASRTEMVRAQIERDTQRKQLSREDFLTSLEVEVGLRELIDVEHPEFSRALELINKSNQFNTTGKRWTKQEFNAGFATNMRLFIFDVKDRFTSYGIVGVIIVEETNIVQFVMSCRVVGMEVEIAAITQLLRIMQTETSRVTALLEETELNLLARDLWERCGFRLHAGQWVHSRSSKLRPPPHIKILVPAGASTALEPAIA